MRAAVLDSFGDDVVLRDVDRPRPGVGEVLIAVAACGVGLTLERARTGALGGTTPRVVGHELGGVVTEIGAGVSAWRAGDRVTASFYLTCGICRRCAGGRETLCENWAGFVGTHVDGALAEFVVLPAHNLVAVPDGVGLDEAAIAADAIATPYHVFAARAPITPGQTVAVIGAGGGVGVHVVEMARAFGANVVGVERDPAKRDQLADFGCQTVLDPGQSSDWADDVLARLRGKVDVCVDTVASASTLSNGLGLVGRAGTMVVLGFQGGVTFEIQPGPLVLDEIVVTGTRYATRAEIARTLELVEQRRVRPVVGARFGLEDIFAAYQAMQAGETFGRIVVDVNPAL